MTFHKLLQELNKNGTAINADQLAKLRNSVATEVLCALITKTQTTSDAHCLADGYVGDAAIAITDSFLVSLSK